MKFFLIKEALSTVLYVVVLNIAIMKNSNSLAIQFIIALLIYTIFSTFPKIHMNPAITFCKGLYREIDSVEILDRIIGQIIGSFISACLISIMTNESDYKSNCFLGFCKDSEFDIFKVLLGEIIGTMILMFIYEYAVFQLNNKIDKNIINKFTFPIFISFGFTSLFYALNKQTGFSLNPARVFGIMIFFNYKEKDFISYLIAPFIGCIIAKTLFDLIFKEEKIRKKNKYLDLLLKENR